MQRFITLMVGSVLAVIFAAAVITDAGDDVPTEEAPAIVETPSHGGLTPLAPDTAEDPFDPAQVQLEPGDPTLDDYVWDADGNLVLRPDYRP